MGLFVAWLHRELNVDEPKTWEQLFSRFRQWHVYFRRAGVALAVIAGIGILALTLGIHIGVGYLVMLGGQVLIVLACIAGLAVIPGIVLGLSIGAEASLGDTVPKVAWSASLSILSIVFGFALMYYWTGAVVKEDDVADFGECIYFSAVTWTNLGYGDWLPVGVGRALAGIQSLVGYVYIGLCVNVVILLASRSSREE